ncbi:MAG: hypothetical protein IJ388_01860 [Oscillospiraceae bacterium]|nr:hypothetical protein [Oscillospiraceae bacterium]
MKFLRKCILFYIGGMGYMTLEFLWRGRSHGSMFALGGTCFLLLGQLYKRCRRICLSFKMLLGATLVTALELLTGLLVNRSYAVWDYRKLPFQFLGQISLVFSLLWMPVSLGAMLLYEQVEQIVNRGRLSRPR